MKHLISHGQMVNVLLRITYVMSTRIKNLLPDVRMATISERRERKAATQHRKNCGDLWIKIELPTPTHVSKIIVIYLHTYFTYF